MSSRADEAAANTVLGARGRPRSPEVDRAILDAAIRLLAEQGYARLSLDAIATEAGVSRPALYRRWSSKADVATAALAHGIDDEPAAELASSTESALEAVIGRLSKRLLLPNNMALVGTLLAEEKQTPELIELFRERVWRRRAQAIRDILARAEERRELREGVDAGAAVHMLIGALYARHLSGEPVRRDFVRSLVSVVLHGVAQPARSAARDGNGLRRRKAR